MKEKTYEAYFRQKMTRFSAGFDTFGVKCGWNQFAPVYATGMYSHYLRDAHFVYLTRADLLAQAISLYIATEAQYFHTIDDLQKDKLAEVEFDFDKISVHLERLIAMQGDWERFFSMEGLQVLRITYEEVAADPAEVFARICRPLGIESARIAVATAYKVVRTELNEVLRAQYVAENRRRVAGYIIR